MIGLALVALAGCAKIGLEGQYQRGLATYNSALEMAVVYREQGQMSDETYLKVDQARAICSGALARMKFAASQGDAVGFNVYYDVLSTMLVEIMVWQKE